VLTVSLHFVLYKAVCHEAQTIKLVTYNKKPVKTQLTESVDWTETFSMQHRQKEAYMYVYT